MAKTRTFSQVRDDSENLLRLEALEKLRALRKRVQERITDENLAPEKAYALAGFGEEAIKSTMESDRQLVEDTQ